MNARYTSSYTPIEKLFKKKGKKLVATPTTDHRAQVCVFMSVSANHRKTAMPF